MKLKESGTDSFDIYDLHNSILKENVSEINWLLQKLSEINDRNQIPKAGSA